jgi:hypothetical protein
MKTTDQLYEMVVSYENGNRLHVKKGIKKLSRHDRARIVALFRSHLSTKVAFEIAEAIILNEL